MIFSEACPSPVSCIDLRGEAAYISVSKAVVVSLVMPSGTREDYSVQPGTNIVWQIEQQNQKKHPEFSCVDNMRLIVLAATANMRDFKGFKPCTPTHAIQVVRKFWRCQMVNHYKKIFAPSNAY